jgi:hypothetical protein
MPNSTQPKQDQSSVAFHILDLNRIYTTTLCLLDQWCPCAHCLEDRASILCFSFEVAKHTTLICLGQLQSSRVWEPLALQVCAL